MNFYSFFFEKIKMSGSRIYYNPDTVESLVKDELEMYKSNRIPPKSVVSFLDKELLYEASDIIARTKNKRMQSRLEEIDPMIAFKVKELAEKKPDVEEDEIRRELIFETNSQLSKLPKYEVSDIQIYCMTATEIREKATVIINSTNKEYGMTNGLFDKRMGSTVRRDLCVICNRDDQGCGGHMGYFELPEKIVNPVFKKECIYSLQCICPYCGELYINEKFFYALSLDKVPKKKLLKIVAELSVKWLWKLHGHDIAKTVYEKDFRESRLCFTVDTGSGKIEKFTRSVANMEKIFSAVPKDKYKLIGFTGATTPLNFLTDVWVCCPPHIRPPRIVNGKIADHPMTERYINILTCLIRLQKHTGTKLDRDKQFDNLYAFIESIAFGPEKKMGMKVPLKESGIFGELKTKKGTLRGHMMGKRVNNCGRTVAGPGFELNIGEVMIPRRSAKNTLLVKVIVHKYNLPLVIKRYREGNYKFIIMKTVSAKGYFEIKERHIKEYTPEIGDILLRPVETGDRGLTGRQPSLHAESILAFNFVLNDWDTVKIHSSNNHCFNADFDGDEFTYHILQDVYAIAEAETIMNFKFHVMNVQSNRPMMALAFHGLMGSFLATNFWEIGGKRSEVTIPEKRWQEAISLLNDSYRKESLEERLKLHGVPLRSGRALMSLALPTNFTYSGSGLTIIDGVLKKGVLKKSNVGLKTLSIVQILAKMYSIKEACRFINDAQKLADWFVMWHGLSLGYRDFNANRNEVIKMLKKDVNKMQIEFYNLGPRPKEEIPFFFWMRTLHGIVDKSKINGKKIGDKYLPINNCLNILSEDRGCGAKGSLANTSQITGSLGEQFIGANIPTYEGRNKKRCLPFYPSNDVSLESIGYVIEGYMDGINPASSLFHEMASRITLIDTARNVSEIGYTHRRVEKSLEPILISWFGFVSSTDGRMFQPMFGAGFNISKVIPVKTPRTGDKIFFCNFEDEANLLKRIHERKLGINDKKRIKFIEKTNEYKSFKTRTGRFPRFSEIEEV